VNSGLWQENPKKAVCRVPMNAQQEGFWVVE